MVINTENSAPILDKDNYVNCTVSVFNADNEFCFSGEGAGIRGRGNTTWEMPKKPYKLKFNKKIDLFGNGKATKWTLIANYSDPSLMRNYLAYSIGAELDNISSTTTKVQFVELYVNDSYDGVYLICEQNEVGETRVDIEDDFAIAQKPENMGFLLEMDGRASAESKQAKDFFTLDDSNYGNKFFATGQSRDYAIQSPEIKDAGDNWDLYYNYIRNYIHQCMLSVSGSDYEKVKELIDVKSFADAYIVHELFNCKDVGQSSFFIFKKENDKLYCGPIWDFDTSSGNCNFNDTSYQEKDSSDYDCLWAKELNIWYYYLLQHTEFQQLVSEKLKGYKQKIVDSINNSIEKVSNLSSSFLRNFKRWDILGKYVWPNSDDLVAITTWEGHVEYLKEWLLNSLNYMISIYCPDISV